MEIHQLLKDLLNMTREKRIATLMDTSPELHRRLQKNRGAPGSYWETLRNLSLELHNEEKNT